MTGAYSRSSFDTRLNDFLNDPDNSVESRKGIEASLACMMYMRVHESSILLRAGKESFAPREEIEASVNYIPQGVDPDDPSPESHAIMNSQMNGTTLSLSPDYHEYIGSLPLITYGRESRDIREFFCGWDKVGNYALNEFDIPFLTTLNQWVFSRDDLHEDNEGPFDVDRLRGFRGSIVCRKGRFDELSCLLGSPGVTLVETVKDIVPENWFYLVPDDLVSVRVYEPLKAYVRQDGPLLRWFYSCRRRISFSRDVENDVRLVRFNVDKESGQ